ncbi:MAG: hypothetical protein CSA84_02610 [Actinomycetales bacterium]|nr:MAG: hypothetical protein CSA84_02610 [Actinomycetales bacterium]
MQVPGGREMPGSGSRSSSIDEADVRDTTTPLKLTRSPVTVQARAVAKAIMVASLSAVGGGLITGTLALLALTSYRNLAGTSLADPADVLSCAMAGIGALLAAWLGLGAALSALSRIPGFVGRTCAELAARIAPAALRRWVSFLLGSSLVGAFVPGTAVADGDGPATRLPASCSVLTVAPDPMFHALDHPTERTDGPPAQTDGSLDPADPKSEETDNPDVAEPAFVPLGPLGPRSLDCTSPPAEDDTAGSAGSRSDSVYVVQPGDTLWGIAAAHLTVPGDGTARPSKAAIAETWPLWYAANRDVIGPDPHHIEPGQRFVLPNGADR